MKLTDREQAALASPHDGGDAVVLADVVRRLRAIVTAHRDLLDWYESEHDRSQYADEDLPEEFVAMEQALRAAEAADTGKAGECG